MIYRGLITAVGGSLPKIMSRITPPATPVMVERINTPTMSDLCSTALNAPVTANAMVPNRSKNWISTAIDRFVSGIYRQSICRRNKLLTGAFKKWYDHHIIYIDSYIFHILIIITDLSDSLNDITNEGLVTKFKFVKFGFVCICQVRKPWAP